MIKLDDASFSYNHKEYLFQELAFHVKKGETLAILGANGVGKTTLLRCMMRFLKWHSGKMEIAGRDSGKMKDVEFWKYISYVPQAKNLIFGYSVMNMVVMGRAQNIGFGQTPKRQDYEIAAQTLDELGLFSLKDRPCTNLSGGQMQMVLIARALVKEPQILIMDEPESNLDMKNQLKVLDVIENISHRKGYTVVINTHFPAHALRCADKTLMLGKKRYLFEETKRVVTSDHIEQYFGVKARIMTLEDENVTYQGIIPLRLKEVANA